MAGSVNKVILIGNVGKDPEIRRTQSGGAFANLRIATSESWRDKATGERKDKTEWHSVVVFNENICKFVEQYVRKGAKLYIEGQLQTRKWQDQAGAERYSTEVVLQNFNSVLTSLDSKGSGAPGGMAEDGQADYGAGGGGSSGQSGYNAEPRSAPAAKAANGTKGFDKKIDDEIPF